MKKNQYISKGCRLLVATMAVMGLSLSFAQAASYPDRTIFGPVGVDLSWMHDFSPPINLALPVPTDAPKIAEWTRSNQPGDTMALTGEALSSFTGEEEGRDTRFVIYGEGWPATDGFIQRLDGQKCAITLPESLLPHDEMYLMWPRNKEGFGRPVAINQTEAWWVSFATVSPGETFYVYGRNLDFGDAQPTNYLYIAENDLWLTNTTANSYRSEYVVPDSLTNGTYTLWAHNGKGREYGWSDSLSIEVESAYVWGTNVYNVEDYGANGSDTNDDTSAIATANVAAKLDFGSTLYFPAGTYYTTSSVKLYKNTKYVGAGMDSTTITTNPSATNSPSLVSPANFNGGSYNIEVRDMTFLANTNTVQKNQVAHLGYMRDNLYENIRISNVGVPFLIGRSQGPFSTHNGVRLEFKGCEFIQTGSAYVSNLKDGRFEDCSFIGLEDCNQYTAILGAKRLDFSGCLVKNHSIANPASGAGWGKGRWITMTSTMTELYVGDSTVTNAGPRRPTPFFGPAPVLSCGPKQNEESIPNFGVYYEQELAVAYIPPEYHDMTVPGAQWAGQHAVTERVVDGVTNSSQTYIKFIDATNNIITVMKPDWSPEYPQVYDSFLVSLKDIVDENSGEIILFEGVASSFSASPVSAAASSMVFSDTNLIAGTSSPQVSIVYGRGIGQSRRIESTDGATGTVTLEKPWNVIPDSTSVVNFGGFANHVLLYDNVFDGRMEGVTNYSAVTALNIYGNGANTVVDGNTMHELGSALSLFAEGYASSRQPNTSVRSGQMFQTFKNNLIDSCRGGTGFSERESTADPSNNQGVRHLGHVIRNNVFINMYGNIGTVTVNSSSTNATHSLLVFQDNVYIDYADSWSEEEGVENLVWVGNSFSGADDPTGYEIAPNHIPVLQGNSGLGIPPSHAGGILELPIRHVELNNKGLRRIIPVLNSGTVQFTFAVEKETESPWLRVSSPNSIVAAQSNEGRIELEIISAPSEDSKAIITVAGGGQTKQITVYFSAAEPADGAGTIVVDLSVFEPGSRVRATVEDLGTPEDPRSGEVGDLGELDITEELIVPDLANHAYRFVFEVYDSASNTWDTNRIFTVNRQR